MQGQRKNRGESALSMMAGICLLLAGAAGVFYAAYKVSYVSVDYGVHVEIARGLDLAHPVQLLRDHPEPVWHLLVRAAMAIGGFSAERAAGLVSGGLCAVTYLLAAHFLYRAPSFSGREYAGGGAAGRRGASGGLASPAEGGSVPEAALSALVLSLVSAVYVPWFNREPYLGQGSPNPWHNPTTLMVRPLGLLVFLLVMGECVRVRQSGFRKGQGLRLRKGILLAVLLLLSNLSKPSFVQIFYPAIFVLMVLWLFLYRFRNFPFALQLLVCCLPSVGLMGTQFLTAFYGGGGGESGGVMLAPFKVAGLYTDNIAVSTLLVLAFPLFAALCALVRRTFDWTGIFAWIMLFVGMAEKFLLAEKGTRLWHGNFNWGYILALYFVWFIAIRDFCSWRRALWGPEAGRKGGVKVGGRRGAAGSDFSLARLAWLLGGALLLAHLFSGIYYLYYMIVLGHGI